MSLAGYVPFYRSVTAFQSVKPLVTPVSNSITYAFEFDLRFDARVPLHLAFTLSRDRLLHQLVRDLTVKLAAFSLKCGLALINPLTQYRLKMTMG